MGPSRDQIRAGHDFVSTVLRLGLALETARLAPWSCWITPQIMRLSQLTGLGSVADLMAAARSRLPPLIAPEPFEADGQRVICYPGDPRHSAPQCAWPGPTRLTWRNGRFEPEGGLAALLAEP